MSTKTNKGNATSVARENVVLYAELANEYGNIRVRTSNAGVNCLVVPKGRPDGGDAWVPISIISAFLQADARSTRLILACARELASGIKGVRPSDFTNDAIRSILGKMKVKLTYVPHSAGEIYVNESTGEQGTYEKDGYNLDTKTKDFIKFGHCLINIIKGCHIEITPTIKHTSNKTKNNTTK